MSNFDRIVKKLLENTEEEGEYNYGFDPSYRAVKTKTGFKLSKREGFGYNWIVTVYKTDTNNNLGWLFNRVEDNFKYYSTSKKLITKNTNNGFINEQYLHRLDGPAIEYPNGGGTYYINGKKYSKEQFEAFNKLKDKNDIGTISGLLDI